MWLIISESYLKYIELEPVAPNSRHTELAADNTSLDVTRKCGSDER